MMLFELHKRTKGTILFMEPGQAAGCMGTKEMLVATSNHYKRSGQKEEPSLC